jgi:hypothetical protein
MTEIEKTEKERIKKKGLKTLKQSGILDSYQSKLFIVFLFIHVF